ncbi:MAG: helicase-related protein [Eubacteriales bacterium]|nr:helicase-related protein [Eubacteriales bacterium]
MLPTLQLTLDHSERADFCVGYFNLRGWRHLESHIEHWSGENGQCCRLMVGMQRLPEEDLRAVFGLDGMGEERIDMRVAAQKRKQLAEEFRKQLTIGVPTNDDEAGLRKLVEQIKKKKVIVKLFLRHPLHAKLYLLFRPDPISPAVGYLGSSNLTFAGLSKQGELNIDVLDHDACNKLETWFEDRWNDRWCIDISEDLVKVIDESWAREVPLPPYYIYMKMVYHLSQDARVGLSEFRIPAIFKNRLFGFQEAAVKIAAHHLNRRGGVVIGDVVGMGKTLTATALARIFEDDHGWETLIICPPKLQKMWEDYRETYGLRGKVMSIGTVVNDLPNTKPYKLVVIDESHNLRNRDGKRYQVIKEYLESVSSRVILLTATPYNKTYNDLSNQLRLFIADEQNLGIRPEMFLRMQDMREADFIRRFQYPPYTISAFEKSDYPDDWRDLMRMYLVRRTRSFIIENYAGVDENGRCYLPLEEGRRSYFPIRIPHTLNFTINDQDASDQYAHLYSDEVVNVIDELNLPRYGLGNYEETKPHKPPTPAEVKQLQGLSRAGKRLMGFCRTNLFKRLESSGQSFMLSLERHILRNYVYLYAIENNLLLPIGTQDAEMLDARFSDEDLDAVDPVVSLFADDDTDETDHPMEKSRSLYSEADFRIHARTIYDSYRTHYRGRFKWLRSDLFKPDLADDLEQDAWALIKLLVTTGEWRVENDHKLNALHELITATHPGEKILIFTQFADTANYLKEQLERLGVEGLEAATGQSSDPTVLAWRFSPVSNGKTWSIKKNQEIRILIATDVLSEGQNLQDCSIVVNYDLPWAIIRLVQRAGRVDRIGQNAERILCYSFLPADGVEDILALRRRVRQRLQESAEVVGTDEVFFDDDRDDQVVRDLYTEKAGVLDGEDDDEVDLASYAFEIWKKAIEKDPDLANIIPALPPVVYSSRVHRSKKDQPAGVLVYMKGNADNDSLTWVDQDGNIVSQSQLAILRAARCRPDTPALFRSQEHHELVQKGVKNLVEQHRNSGGQLGPKSKPRYKIYHRLKRLMGNSENTIFEIPSLNSAIDEIYKYPLTEIATEAIMRQLKAEASDEELARLVLELWEERRLCMNQRQGERTDPLIVCSMGLLNEAEVNE